MVTFGSSEKGHDEAANILRVSMVGLVNALEEAACINGPQEHKFWLNDDAPESLYVKMAQ